MKSFDQRNTYLVGVLAIATLAVVLLGDHSRDVESRTVASPTAPAEVVSVKERPEAKTFELIGKEGQSIVVAEGTQPEEIRKALSIVHDLEPKLATADLSRVPDPHNEGYYLIVARVN